MTEPSRARDERSQTTELRRQARDLALLGKHRKAAELYQRLLERSPGDAQTALRLAELRRRIGDPSGARSAYQQAIALYLDAGWDTKALAVETALERLQDVSAIGRVRIGAAMGWLTAWLAIGLQTIRRVGAKLFHAARFGRTT